MPRPIRALIDLSALRHNLAAAKRHAGAARIWAVVKANAYGHGLARAAAAFADADGLAMLDFDEAVRLRVAGEVRPMLMLEGAFRPGDVALAAEHRLTLVVHSVEQLRMLESASPGAPIDAYFKVNSGMNRLGFTAENAQAAWQRLRAHPGVRSLALMTHFADADGPGGVAAQLERFEAAVRPLEAAGSAPRSLANSAALLRYAGTRADWVRPGIMLYGCSPFGADPAAGADALGLRPAMTLASELIAVQTLRAGDRVGYGFTFEAARDMTLGVVACGYADGYPRHAPSGTPILVGGERTRTVGRVSMDMICADITGIPGAGIGTPVTLWGEGLSADEVAASAGTVSYELLCALAARVPVAEAG